jgi:hypothetical protein
LRGQLQADNSVIVIVDDPSHQPRRFGAVDEAYRAVMSQQ